MIYRFNISKKYDYILLICFFSPYFGIAPFAYGFMILNIIISISNKFKLIIYEYIFLFFFLLLLCFKFYQVNFFVFDAITRYYLGVIIVFLFIKFNNIKINIEKLIFFFFIVLSLEAILINVFINPFQYLPNYPKSVFDFDIASHYTKFMGFYQRPYSVGMNASASSTIICGLLMYRAVLINEYIIKGRKIIEFVGLLSVLLFASGVGISLYFIYLFYRLQFLTFSRFLFGFILILTIFYNYDSIIGFFSDDSIFQKVSSAYIDFLWHYKTDQVISVLQILKENNNSIWIGQMFNKKSEIIIQSDFAWNDFFQCLGIFGLIVYTGFLFNKINKINFFPVFLLLLGAFHYGGIFTISGQIILSLLLLHPRKFV